MKLIHSITFILLAAPHAFAEAPAPKPKPEFQYKTEGIEVSIPTADEPKVSTFNAGTIKAAAKYLDDGAICWVREKTCVNCHTTGPHHERAPRPDRCARQT
jgi:squalene-hopene/tetraprenyl-beta-curcumene cyclase